jgi:hypothetical protein
MNKLTMTLLLALLGVQAAIADNLAFTRLEPLNGFNPSTLQPGQNVSFIYDASRSGTGPNAGVILTVDITGNGENISVVDNSLSLGSTWSISNVGTLEVSMPQTGGSYVAIGCLEFTDQALKDAEAITADNCSSLSLTVEGGAPAPPPSDSGAVVQGSILIESDGVAFALTGVTNDCGTNTYLMTYDAIIYPSLYAALLKAKDGGTVLTPTGAYCSTYDELIVDSLGL